MPASLCQAIGFARSGQSEDKGRTTTGFQQTYGALHTAFRFTALLSMR